MPEKGQNACFREQICPWENPVIGFLGPYGRE